MRPRAAPAPETGALLHFEHVNLRVPDHRTATLFFVEGLGLTRDPYRMVGVRNMWVNVGTQQFHLPIGEPTPLPGEVGLVVPDVDWIERQLDRVGRELKDTAFETAREGAEILTTTPWGHRIRVVAAGPEARFPLGLAYVEFWAAPGTSEGIGAFYRQCLQCPVESRPVAIRRCGSRSVHARRSGSGNGRPAAPLPARTTSPCTSRGTAPSTRSSSDGDASWSRTPTSSSGSRGSPTRARAPSCSGSSTRCEASTIRISCGRS